MQMRECRVRDLVMAACLKRSYDRVDFVCSCFNEIKKNTFTFQLLKIYCCSENNKYKLYII